MCVCARILTQKARPPKSGCLLSIPLMGREGGRGRGEGEGRSERRKEGGEEREGKERKKEKWRGRVRNVE